LHNLIFDSQPVRLRRNRLRGPTVPWLTANGCNLISSMLPAAWRGRAAEHVWKGTDAQKYGSLNLQ
jgi:hypothetical protein